MNMNMNNKIKANDDELKSLLDEVQYLIHNNIFQKELVRIRKKHKIPIDGFGNNKKDYDKWWNQRIRKHRKPIKLMDFENDLLSLTRRCRFQKSKHLANFPPILRHYILIGEIRHHFNIAISALPDLEIDDSSDCLVLKIKLYFDTTLKDIVKMLQMKRLEIKKAQEKIAGKRLKPSKRLDDRIKLWKLNMKEGLSVKEISQMISNEKIKNIPWEELLEFEIKKLIRRTNYRIQNSFR